MCVLVLFLVVRVVDGGGEDDVEGKGEQHHLTQQQDVCVGVYSEYVSE